MGETMEARQPDPLKIWIENLSDTFDRASYIFKLTSIFEIRSSEILSEFSNSLSHLMTSAHRCHEIGKDDFDFEGNYRKSKDHLDRATLDGYKLLSEHSRQFLEYVSGCPIWLRIRMGNRKAKRVAREAREILSGLEVGVLNARLFESHNVGGNLEHTISSWEIATNSASDFLDRYWKHMLWLHRQKKRIEEFKFKHQYLWHYIIPFFASFIMFNFLLFLLRMIG